MHSVYPSTSDQINITSPEYEKVIPQSDPRCSHFMQKLLNF